MGVKAKGYVRLRGNVSIDTFLSLCKNTFSQFPTAKQWNQLMCFSPHTQFPTAKQRNQLMYFSPHTLFPMEKILETLMFRYIRQFNNLLVDFVPRKRLTSFNLIYEGGLRDCFSYVESSSCAYDDEYFEKNCGLIELDEDLFYFKQCYSLGLGLVDTLPKLKYFSLDGCCVCSESEELEAFLETLPSNEHSGKEIVTYFLPELMDSDPDIYSQSRMMDYVCEAAAYSSDYQDFTIYESKCLLAYHEWLKETGMDLSEIEKSVEVIELCEKILKEADVLFDVTEFIATKTAYYFIRLDGYSDNECICTDCKCVYPMVSFALVAIDVILQYLNSRYYFYVDTEEKEV